MEQVRVFLRSHPDFLERFVMEEVELEQLERWMIRSTQRAKKRPDAPGTGKNGRKTSLSRWKFCVHADKRQMLQELTKSLQQKPTKAHVLWELAGCICSAIGAEGYRLYLAERGDPESLGLYLGQDGRLIEDKMKTRGHASKSAELIKNRWKSLKSMYATCKKQLGKSGAGRRECDYYDQLD
ncbi:hypothetical protein C0J52_18546 [Blattella germanica]|nr:hypothetical protein C0J52_18546 [Blattella germanica]